MISTPIDISPCTPADLASVESSWPLRGCADRYARQQAGESVFLLARSATRVLGRVEVLWLGPKMPLVAGAYPQVPELNGLDVLPEARRRGVGTALVRTAEALARARGCRAIGLGVGLDNAEAERLYRRLGYDGDLAYTDTYVWIDEDGASHDAADRCRFLTKPLV